MRILEVDGKKTWAMVAKHHPLPSIKRSKGTIWTTDFKQCCSVQKDCNNQGTKGKVVKNILETFFFL